jgi:hypothetical protein
MPQTLPGEILSDENLDRIVKGKSVRRGPRRPPKPRKRPRRFE